MSDPRTRRAFACATFAATLSPVVIMVLFLLAAKASVFAVLYLGVLTVGIGYVLACAGCLLIGMPVHIAFRCAGVVSLWAYLTAGAVSGLILAVALFGFHWPPWDDNPFMGSLSVSTMAAGPLAAWAFWHTLRPDLGERFVVNLRRSIRAAEREIKRIARRHCPDANVFSFGATDISPATWRSGSR